MSAFSILDGDFDGEFDVDRVDTISLRNPILTWWVCGN